MIIVPILIQPRLKWRDNVTEFFRAFFVEITSLGYLHRCLYKSALTLFERDRNLPQTTIPAGSTTLKTIWTTITNNIMSTIVDIRASEIQIVHTTNIGKETAILFIR